MPGVRRITYSLREQPMDAVHNDARPFAKAMARAEAAAHAALQVKKLGFEPDIIIGHHGWGELLNMQRRVARRADARLPGVLLQHRGL